MAGRVGSGLSKVGRRRVIQGTRVQSRAPNQARGRGDGGDRVRDRGASTGLMCWSREIGKTPRFPAPNHVTPSLDVEAADRRAGWEEW